MKEKKNLIIVHLESLNTSTFDNKSRFMPFLHSFKENCEYFENYFSTSTSTLLTISDLFFMDMHCTDEKTSLNDFLNSEYSGQNLWDILKKEGYFCDNIYFRLNEEERPNFIKLNKILNKEDTSPVFIDDIEELDSKIDAYMDKERFALFLFDGYSHIDCLRRDDYLSDNHMEMVYGRRFLYLDDTMRWLLKKMKDTNHLSDTIIVMYGDHGDDYYSHGVREGYTHATEPNGQLIHCPLLVFDGQMSGNKTELFSTVNVGGLILSKMQICEHSPSPNYVFSRNLFPAQRKRAKVLNKGYSVCNGEWLLLVDQQGEALYNLKLDELCCKNMLDFFIFRHKKLQYNKVYDSVLSTHYKGFMTQSMKDEIKAYYYLLKNEMIVYLNNISRFESRPKLFRIKYSESLKIRLRMALRLNKIEHFWLSVKEKIFNI